MIWVTQPVLPRVEGLADAERGRAQVPLDVERDARRPGLDGAWHHDADSPRGCCCNVAMTVAVVGLIGVLVGAAVAAAYGFWSTRRSELGDAFVAASILAEELRDLLEANANQTLDSQPLVAAWRTQRGALVAYLYPEEFQSLGSSMLRAQRWHRNDEDLRTELEATLGELSVHAERLREDHQAFLITPLARYLRTRPWSRRRRTSRAPVLKQTSRGTTPDAD
jgi:hypothetical protein